MNPLPRGRGRWHQRLLYLGMVAAAAVPVVGVVGAGVVGCSVAYHLASAMPATKIVVMDPHAPAVAVAATSRSAGCVISASDAAEKCLLSVQTLADVSALQRLLDTDLGYRRSGCLRLATDSADLEVLRHQAEITTKAVGGGGAVVLDRGEAERKVPWLCCAEANVAGALWTEGDGVMDPTVLAGGYLQGARKLGAVEMLPAVAASVALRGDRAVGCRLSDGGTVACDHVVNAAGSWANLLTAGLGDLAGLPMAPTRSHYWLSQSMPSHFDGGDPIVIMPGARAYTRPEGPHGCLLGLQEEVSLSWDARQLPAPDAHPSLCAEMVGGDGEEAQDALLAQFDSLCHFFPSAAEVGWGHYTAGLSSYTVDGDYLVGELPGVRGLSVATGCNGSMLSAAGGVGRIIATQVMQDLAIGARVDVHKDMEEAQTCAAAHGDVAGALPSLAADHASVLGALGAGRYAPSRFLQGVAGTRWDEECAPYGGGDVFSTAFRAQCAARRGAKFQRNTTRD